LRNSLAACLLVVVLIMGLTAGWLGGYLKATGSTQAQTTIVPLTQPPRSSEFVYLDVIPDWGGATYDAFVNPSRANGTVPNPATNSTGPGPMDNNITVSAGVTVTFVITNIDTAVLMNFTGPVSTDFTVYNDTATGQVASHYSKGQLISSLPISHTFTIAALNLNIPIPPDTIITFTHTFSTPGVYEYVCETPCGPGMSLVGYMNGYVIVS
jgi:plastocyanin